jgi:hypothetical protein
MAVAFLASDDASFITASSCLVDGGISGGVRHASVAPVFTFVWLIWASWLILGAIAPAINRRARINHGDVAYVLGEARQDAVRRRDAAVPQAHGTVTPRDACSETGRVAQVPRMVRPGRWYRLRSSNGGAGRLSKLRTACQLS